MSGNYARIQSQCTLDEQKHEQQKREQSMRSRTRRRKLMARLDRIIGQLEDCNMRDRRHLSDEVFDALKHVYCEVAVLPDVDANRLMQWRPQNNRKVDKALDLCFDLQHWVLYGEPE